MKLPVIPGYGRVHKRTRPDGRTVYIADHRDRNDVRRQPTFPTAREAADALTKAYREWPGRGAAKVSYTVGEMVTDYLAHREEEFAQGRTCGGPACRLGVIRPSTIEGDRAHAATVINGLGTRQAEDPQARNAIRRWLDEEERTGDRRSNTPGPLSTRAVAARASILRRAYLYAIEDTGTVKLQAPPVPRVNVQYRGGGVLITDAQLDAFRAAVHPNYREMVDCLIATGARIGEVCDFDLADLNPARGTLRVRASKTAAGTNRVLSLPDYLVRDLEGMLRRRYADGRTPDPADPLFTNTRGGRVGDDPFRRRIWDPAAAKAGIPGVKPHSLRHTLATKAAEEGVDPFALMAHFGWADIRQSRTYVKLARQGVPAIAALTERRIG